MCGVLRQSDRQKVCEERARDATTAAAVAAAATAVLLVCLHPTAATTHCVSLGLSMRLTSANLRVFLALPMVPVPLLFELEQQQQHQIKCFERRQRATRVMSAQ